MMQSNSYSQTRRAYPSDITESQWSCIKPLLTLPSQKSNRGRKCHTDLREVVNAINYRWSTGCVWRMLPHDLPAWNTIYYHFHRWEQDGTLKKLREILLNRRQSPYLDFAPAPTKRPLAHSTPDWPVKKRELQSNIAQ